MAGYDIHFQPVPASEVFGFKTFEFGYKAALKVKGPQALVNRWVKTLMTPRGSDPLYTSEGTAFWNLPGSNITDVSNDLSDAVNLSIQDANDQVHQQDIAGLFPDNERLLNAELLNFQPNSSGDGFDVWVRIRNVAGESIIFRLISV